MDRAWRPNFPAAWAVGNAAATLAAATALDAADSRRRARTRLGLLAEHGPDRPVTAASGRWAGDEEVRPRITVSPGGVKISRSDPARAERTRERELHVRQVDSDQAAAVLVRVAARRAAGGLLGLTDAELDDLGLHAAAPDVRRGRIAGWSRKSRANMVRRFGTLDYGPLVDHGRPLAMVTLTLPGDWTTVAGTRDQWNGLVRAWQERYARRWGHRLVGLWKVEFQRRGAPHLHVLCAPENVDGAKEFRSWLSASWADVVAHPDPVERMRHESAGTAIDWNDGLRATDPKRVAVYFLKHGLLAGKEYQNEAPAEWQADEKVGRFWGFWGLDPVEVPVEVTTDQADQAARTLRRWQAARLPRCLHPVRSDGGRKVAACNDCRARGVFDVLPPVRRAEHWSTERCTVHTDGPARGPAAHGGDGCRKCLRGGSLDRRVKARRVRRMPGTYGWVAVSDGAAAANMLAQLWAERPKRTDPGRLP